MLVSTPSRSVIPGETLLSTSTIGSSSLTDFGIGASLAGFTGAKNKLITSRNKTANFLPRKNHRNLIPLKRVQSHKSPLCNKSIIFGNVNARSLRNKAGVFVDHATDTKIDLCAVTETWLRAEDTVDLVSLAPRGYSFRSAPRTDGRNGGGTGVFVRDSLNIAFSESQQQQSFESSKWNIVACARSTKFVIVYRPPYSETHPVTTNVFMQEFSVFLENLVLCP